MSLGWYATKLRIIVPIAVEAESQEEAERIIDGVVNAKENPLLVSVYEMNKDALGVQDVLEGKPERIERDEIERQAGE